MDIEKLGRYDIVRVLGKGAMGVVYEGRDPNLDRRVAIKTIRVQTLSAEAAIEYEGRFRTEARSAARLHHPNIVSVFDSGQDGNIAYLVMEYVQGEDLKHHLECGAKFSVRASIVMVHELLLALDHAHRQNVVHRDIKPANLLLEISGRVKLTDFGVARIQDPDEASLTQVGGAVGTPKYMSPEQAKGQRGDSRSDVFSAGVVLYELLTGKLPFDGENQFVIIHQIVNHEPTPATSLRPELPAAMDEVLARALAKSPEQRFATAREFALALRAVAQQMPAQEGAADGDGAAAAGLLQTGTGAGDGTNAALRDGSSTGIFGPAEDVSLVSTISHDDELAGWNKVSQSVDPQAVRGFLERFPSGIYARRAQQQLDRLLAGQSGDPDATVTRLEPAQASAPAASGPTTTAPAAVIPVVPEPAPASNPAPAPAISSPATPVAAAPARAKGPVAADAPLPVASGAPGGSKKWLLVAVGGLACAVGVAAIFLTPSEPNEPVGKVETAQALDLVAPAAPSSTPIAAASAPASDAKSAASKPIVVAASAPASRPIKPAHAVASQPVVPKPVPRPSTPTAVATSEPVVTPAPVASAQTRTGGPSAPGNVCADRVFLFRIACVAKACTTDRFRDTKECVEFREMERAREEQRNFQR